MAHSRSRRVSVKPNWRKSRGLHPDFPLFPHGDKRQPQRLRWAKKVRGKLHYFGKVEGDEKGVAALARWLQQKDDLLAGRPPRDASDGLTVAELCNRFLAAKRADVDLGKLSPRTFYEYTRTTAALVDACGRDRAVLDLGPEDFERLYSRLAAKHGLTTLGREVVMVRSVFKYALEADLIDRAVRFGPRFKAPTKAEKRKHKARQRHARGARVFSAAEIRALLGQALPQLRAMILLGINCGFGNTDCATLPRSALDLQAGWLDFPRPKTGIERRVPLWPETVAALEAVLADRVDREKRTKRNRPLDPETARLVFITRLGQPWVRYRLIETPDSTGRILVSGRAQDAIACEMTKLLKSLGIQRPGLSFYALRHTFETVAGASTDQVAVDAIMGHVDASMAAEYRERIDDWRLKAVVDHVRGWLLGEAAPHAADA